MNIHVKREVKKSSLDDLFFRRQIPAALSSEGAYSPKSLPHHTIASAELAHVEGGLGTIAQLLRMQDDNSPESILAKVRDIDIYGRHLDGSRLSIGLSLETNEAFERDHEYFKYLLGDRAVRSFSPHITVLSINNPSTESTVRALEWIERRAPMSVHLGKVSIKVEIDLDSATTIPSPRTPFEDISQDTIAI